MAEENGPFDIDPSCHHDVIGPGCYVLFEDPMANEEFEQIQAVADVLIRNANANLVFIFDKKGKMLASSGDMGLLDTSKPLNGKRFLLEAKIEKPGKPNTHMEIVGERVILGIFFDSTSTLARVISGVEIARKELCLIFESLVKKEQALGTEPSIPEFTDDEIDEVFLD